ncbi:MAG: hypothetical protein GJU73_12555 [Ferrovum sp.]|jgi:hypothetical protein|uniref:hypothetical protein n=1 Tax=Ferrovum sp. TaxID=2609467 RepID=UPI0026365489|nr:hypothetical protein [Ferrovum sp.]MBW8068254.1 hypothetical protein [Ferrovum sp.]
MGFRIPQQYIGGAPGNNSVVVTAGAANVLGAWASFGNTPYPINRLIFLVDTTIGGTQYSSLFNIAFGPSGSQVVLIPNIFMYSQSANSGYLDLYLEVDIPILPAGTPLWVNLQSTDASITPRVSLAVQFTGHGKREGVSTLGAVTSDSSGTPFVLASGSYGAWTSLGTLSIPATRMILTAVRAVSSLQTVNIGIGAAGSQSMVVQDVPVIYNNPALPFEGNFPPGEYWIQGQGDTETVWATALFY